MDRCSVASTSGAGEGQRVMAQAGRANAITRRGLVCQWCRAGPGPGGEFPLSGWQLDARAQQVLEHQQQAGLLTRPGRGAIMASGEVGEEQGASTTPYMVDVPTRLCVGQEGLMSVCGRGWIPGG